MAKQPHVLAIPYPAQGHVAPLMKLSLQIAAHGVKVTFVNTERIHAQIQAAMPEEALEQNPIRLVSIPDGLQSEDDRKDAIKVMETLERVMAGHLKHLIEKINQSSDDEHITCVIADSTICWALEVAKVTGVSRAAFWPAGPAPLVLNDHIPRLVEAGILNTDGTAASNKLICLSNDIPAWRNDDLPWRCPGNPMLQKYFFGRGTKNLQNISHSNWFLCNSVCELDSSACNLIPNLLPIGPILTSGPFAGSLKPEDSACSDWLDKQVTGSVIYVAFGSTAQISQQQLDELAIGLELAENPFLWVVRSDLMNGTLAKFPEGFTDRIADHGKFVSWAPQEKVLAHPSVACFLSHCGWNSTMEGLAMGVPFLCWPYFADQFHNMRYICEKWKIGLGLDKNENGIITRQEIVGKIKALLSCDGIKANVLHVKEIATRSVETGGSSLKNLESFIEQLKQLDA